MNIVMEEIDVDDDPEICPVVGESTMVLGECTLCKYGSSKNPVFLKMDQMERELTGTVNQQVIYASLYQLFTIEMKNKLVNQGQECPNITIDEIARHYKFHKLNEREVISNDIVTIGIMQEHLKDSQIASQKKDGLKTYNLKCVDAYVRLSKHKLDLIKFLKSSESKNKASTNKLKPYEFSA